MRESQKLLSYGFRYFETQQLYEADVPLKTTDVYYAAADGLELGVTEPVRVTIPRGHFKDLQAELTVASVIKAPVTAGDEFGTLRLALGGETVYEAPLVALAAVEEGGLFTQIGDFFRLLFADLLASE